VSDGGTFSQDARSSTSEASSRGIWLTAGYGKSQPQEQWDAGKPPWRKD
jgi:hypothetical protein